MEPLRPTHDPYTSVGSCPPSACPATCWMWRSWIWMRWSWSSSLHMCRPRSPPLVLFQLVQDMQCEAPSSVGLVLDCQLSHGHEEHGCQDAALCINYNSGSPIATIPTWSTLWSQPKCQVSETGQYSGKLNQYQIPHLLSPNTLSYFKVPMMDKAVSKCCQRHKLGFFSGFSWYFQ